MMKRMALFTIGLCILSVGFIASGVEPEDQQATTIRQLRAEVQMLRATVASLQVEVAKLKADLKQQSASPDKVAVPSTQPTTAPVPGTENDRVIKANLKYGRILDSANATQAQKQAAYISYYKETVGISVTINYEVSEVTIQADGVVKISARPSLIKHTPIVRGYVMLLINIPRADALQIKQGDSLTLTGILDVNDPRHPYTPKGGIVVGELIYGHTQLRTPPIIGSYADYSIKGCIQKGFVVTLNGKRVEVIDSLR